MSLKNGSVLEGATFTPSGGTALSLISDGLSVNNGARVFDVGTVDPRTRRTATFKQKFSQLVDRLTGRMSKDVKSCSFVWPTVDATTGEIEFNKIYVERQLAGSFYVAGKDTVINGIMAQILTDGDYASFWAKGSVE